MKIVIGESSQIHSAGQYKTDNEPVSVEARLLEIKDRQENSSSGPVVSGRIITLLVPEGQKIPRGIESGDYRIYLRFVHRRSGKF